MKGGSSNEIFPIQQVDDSIQVVQNEHRISAKSGTIPLFIGISIYAGGIVRYRIEQKAVQRWSFPLVHKNNLKVVKPHIEKNQTSILLATDEITVKIDCTPYCLSIIRPNGTVLVQEFPNDVNTRSEWMSAPTGLMRLETGEFTARMNFSYGQHITYYGLGERFSSLERNNRKTTIWNDNPYGSGTDKAYKNIPLMVSTGGYGLLLQETAPSTWDMGSTSNFSFSIAVDQPGIDLFIIPGDDMKAILSTYADITAHAPMPPRWSFGLWVSPFGNYLDAGSSWRQKEFLEFVEMLDQKQMPCDVIHLDPYWMGKTKKLCDFLWDKVDFPNPEQFIGRLQEMGLRLCLWEHPYIEKGSNLYEEGEKHGYLLKKADGSVYDYHIVIVPAERRKEEQNEYVEDFYALGSAVDFSNPDAAAWYKNLHRPLIEMGTATFKTDFGEAIPYDAYFSNGKTGREMHNIYPYLYNRTVWEVQEEYFPQPFLWGRSGYMGSQAFPVQWSGDPISDFRSLRTTIIGGLNYGMSGIPFWSFDMGGFKGRPSSTAYVRWSQVGLFLSHSRFHGTTSRMPWDFGEKAEQAVMKAILLRYRLLPYIYAAAYEAVSIGLPVIRALPLEFEHDFGARKADTEFLFGSSILIVPVLDESGAVDVYLPEGRWYDFTTEELFEGPKTFTFVCPIDRIPLFVREGGIISMVDPTLRVQNWHNKMSIHVYGVVKVEGNSEHVQKITIPEESGHRNTVVQTFTNESGLITVSIDSDVRDWNFVFHHMVQEPRHITIDDVSDQSYAYNSEQQSLKLSLHEKGTCVIEIKEV